MMTPGVVTDSDSISLIELHDSKVEAILISSAGDCRIEFAHLPVYHPRDTEAFEIWSYRASLLTTSVDYFLCDGDFQVRDYVDDAQALLDGENIVIVNWKLLLDRQAVSRITFIFGSGRKIDLKCQSAQIMLHERVRHVEDWVGPLDSSPEVR
jgi:hypothetical protein